MHLRHSIALIVLSVAAGGCASAPTDGASPALPSPAPTCDARRAATVPGLPRGGWVELYEKEYWGSATPAEARAALCEGAVCSGDDGVFARDGGTVVLKARGRGLFLQPRFRAKAELAPCAGSTIVPKLIDGGRWLIVEERFPLPRYEGLTCRETRTDATRWFVYDRAFGGLLDVASCPGGEAAVDVAEETVAFHCGSATRVSPVLATADCLAGGAPLPEPEAPAPAVVASPEPEIDPSASSPVPLDCVAITTSVIPVALGDTRASVEARLGKPSECIDDEHDDPGPACMTPSWGSLGVAVSFDRAGPGARATGVLREEAWSSVCAPSSELELVSHGKAMLICAGDQCCDLEAPERAPIARPAGGAPELRPDPRAGGAMSACLGSRCRRLGTKLAEALSENEDAEPPPVVTSDLAAVALDTMDGPVLWSIARDRPIALDPSTREVPSTNDEDDDVSPETGASEGAVDDLIVVGATVFTSAPSLGSETQATLRTSEGKRLGPPFEVAAAEGEVKIARLDARHFALVDALGALWVIDVRRGRPVAGWRPPTGGVSETWLVTSGDLLTMMSDNGTGDFVIRRFTWSHGALSMRSEHVLGVCD